MENKMTTELTAQDTFDTLKYGYVSYKSCMNHVEEIIPGLFRNFKREFHHELYNALSKNKMDIDFPSCVHSGIRYEVQFLTKITGKQRTASTNIIFEIYNDKENGKTIVSMRLRGEVRLSESRSCKISKNIDITCASDFKNAIMNWQSFLDTKLEKYFDRLETIVKEIPQNKLYIVLPDFHNEKDEVISRNLGILLDDIAQMKQSVMKNLDNLKSFGTIDYY
jgi:hypothetical protein